MSATVPKSEVETVTVYIDDVPVVVPKGTLVVEAAKAIQTDIPVYCYHEKLGPAGLCRICLVGIEGMPKLQIACNTPVAEGMKVLTRGDKVEEGRRAILEFFLLNHPLDCPICDKGGECDLQDYAMAYGQGASRMVDAKSSKPKAIDLGPTIVLDEERCVVCQRCVRFDQIITREDSLRTEDRGAQTIIATATGKPYVSDFTGNVTELCPVGALTSKTYRFRSRPWDNHRTTTSCTQCSVGCQMHVDQRADVLLRTMSVPEDDAISDSWLCDRGRYGIGFVNDERRLTQPMLRQADGTFTQIDWDDAIALWAKELKAAGKNAGVLGGGRLLNEELLLAQHVFRGLGIENIDHRVGRATIVHSDQYATHVDLEHANTIVTIGRPPSQLAPILDLRIRKAVSRNGATLISVGDHAANSFVPETRATTAEALTKALEGTIGRLAVVWDGVMIPGGPDLLAPVHAAESRATHVDRYVLPETPNGRGADAIGMRPGEGGMNTRAMLEAARDGKLHTLAIIGANPMLSYPDRELVAAALTATPFVVVTELFLTDTAAMANLVLPVASAFEKTGTTTDFAGDVLPVMGAVRAPEGLYADGDLFAMLADALGVAMPDLATLEATARDRVRTAPTPAPDAAPPSFDKLRMTNEGATLRVIAETTIFAGGGTLAHDARVETLRTVPRARVHPKTAKRLGFAAGDMVSVTSGEKSLGALELAVDAKLPEDAVALVDGIVGSPLNVFGDADVTLARPAVLA